MLNGRDIDFIRGIKTELNDDDTVAIFPPVAGGYVEVSCASFKPNPPYFDVFEQKLVLK